MTEQDVLFLKRVCKARGENLSTFIRRAIKLELGRLSLLNDEEKMALGLASMRETEG
jgi:hypothetical protein